jgi:hypothetical protein
MNCAEFSGGYFVEPSWAPQGLRVVVRFRLDWQDEWFDEEANVVGRVGWAGRL